MSTGTADPMLTRAAPLAGTLDVDARTIDVVFASDAPVRRRSWEFGYYDEVLLCAPDNVDLTRAGNMSLLDSHGAYSVDDRLGSVLPGSVRFERGRVIATIKLSRRPKAEELLQDLEDGHGLAVSVGYRILKEEKIEATAGGLPTIRATLWQPMEISVVPVPADPNAKTRGIDMTEQTQTNEPIRHEQRYAPANIVQERTRISEIRHLARSAGLTDEIVDDAISSGETVAAFRSRAFDALVQRQAEAPTFPHVSTPDSGHRSGGELKARQDALVARMTGKSPEGEARAFMTTSLLDHARGLLEAQGVRTATMSREAILGYRRSYGMHTTSDFQSLLQGAGERVLMDAYQVAQSPLKTLLSRRSSAVDFRAKSKLKISDAGLLEKVNEAGEIRATTRSEAAESYKVETYARIFALSFQAIVNDDLGAFSDWSIQAGRMAAATENKVLLDLLTSGGGAGPVMGEDGKRLFHGDHSNMAGAGSALDMSSLGVAILALRKQTSLGGQRIAVAPRYLLVGPELELIAQKLVATISPATTDDAIPDAIKSLVPVVEPNLDGKSWYIFADPAAAPILEWSYLAGHEGPQVDSRDGFERLGTEFRAVLHFGAGAIDHRGAYRNPGL